ncbi:MAG: hypothetical protein A2X11_02415 [Bacteroidetes bacterium GWE2_42_24]|nr:MAG: hypothetical protein A2X11_02415 [Bacteroidetes bacterium GWE2_42_24]OFY25399.1 MAG: hypothetical protein A2X09_02900 [Bacteroidetes bacterium GWF2_43_11]PKP21556.1 MAG: hypothetical protein CVU06_10000 [Bacteroidetes bacterium HGW-Bacteroidetes-22]
MTIIYSQIAIEHVSLTSSDKQTTPALEKYDFHKMKILLSNQSVSYDDRVGKLYQINIQNF